MTQRPSIRFEALGTHWFISCENIDKHASRIAQTLEDIDRRWSRFRDDSEVSRLAKEGGELELSTHEFELMRCYKQLYDATDGRVTPLIGDVLVDAGYDATYTLQPKSLIRSPLAWDEALVLQSKKLQVLRPTLIDIGAAGKGYAIDRVADILAREAWYVIDAGGDMRSRGPLEVGLEDPYNPKHIFGSGIIDGQSIAASATHLRAWGDWHHVIDPKRVRPVRDVIASWVVSGSAMWSDGLATALFFVDPERLADTLKQPFAYMIAHRNGQIVKSRDAILRLNGAGSDA